MPEFSAGQELTGTNMSQKGIGMRGNRISTSSGSTSTEVAVLRIDDKSVKAGRSYRVSATGVHMQSTVAADAIKVRLRYTTDGTTPTTGSTELPGSGAYDRIHTANSAQTHVIETRYDPASDQTLSVVITITRLAGTGSCTLFGSATDSLSVEIVDEGVAVSDTGTDL
jgi:hypothetical protein